MEKGGDFDTEDNERPSQPKKIEDEEVEVEALLDKDLIYQLNVDLSTISRHLKAIGMIRKQMFGRDLFWCAQHAARALMFRLRKKQIVPTVRYLLVLHELSDEEAVYHYINTSDITDKEYLKGNYLKNSENDVNDLQDIENLSKDDSDAKESKYL
ncbi:hypothetical protein AVEN_259907-1 [Araneus ventricosus]|uniref:Uncharacterized protein n=1 Tax=Araneus ventricosus TaxID=182803 RepID=A0A4Y2IYS4_ARAVE|nr:hypothetical protein AVEN_259907-1 [Araneus ventricosus]